MNHEHAARVREIEEIVTAYYDHRPLGETYRQKMSRIFKIASGNTPHRAEDIIRANMDYRKKYFALEPKIVTEWWSHDIGWRVNELRAAVERAEEIPF